MSSTFLVSTTLFKLIRQTVLFQLNLLKLLNSLLFYFQNNISPVSCHLNLLKEVPTNYCTSIVISQVWQIHGHYSMKNQNLQVETLRKRIAWPKHPLMSKYMTRDCLIERDQEYRYGQIHTPTNMENRKLNHTSNYAHISSNY